MGDFWPVQEDGDSPGLLLLAPGLIQFHKPLVGEIEVIVVRNGRTLPIFFKIEFSVVN